MLSIQLLVLFITDVQSQGHNDISQNQHMTITTSYMAAQNFRMPQGEHASLNKKAWPCCSVKEQYLLEFPESIGCPLGIPRFVLLPCWICFFANTQSLRIILLIEEVERVQWGVQHITRTQTGVNMVPGADRQGILGLVEFVLAPSKLYDQHS